MSRKVQKLTKESFPVCTFLRRYRRGDIGITTHLTICPLEGTLVAVSSTPLPIGGIVFRPPTTKSSKRPEKRNFDGHFVLITPATCAPVFSLTNKGRKNQEDLSPLLHSREYRRSVLAWPEKCHRCSSRDSSINCSPQERVILATRIDRPLLGPSTKRCPDCRRPDQAEWRHPAGSGH